MKVEEVAIIGSGPSGMTAALQLRRSGIAPLLFESTRFGGLLVNANLVENYPGFPGGVSGPKLVQLFEQQACTSGVEVIFEEVVELDHDGAVFHITSNMGRYRSRFAVIATGTKAVTFPPGVIQEDALSRVLYEVSPIRGVKNRKIAIVGAGDASFDYALSLERHNQVYILNRGRSIKCLPLLWDRTSVSQRIQYQAEIEVKFVSSTADGGLLLKCKGLEGEREMEVDYLIGALGRVPRLDFVSARLAGMIEELERQGILNLIGDVKNGRYRQTAIATGDGLLAAMKICQLMEVQ